MKVYDSILTQFKPPHGSTQLQYTESFDIKFTLWLIERRLVSLEGMMNDAIEVEISQTIARKKGREEGERRKKEYIT